MLRATTTALACLCLARTSPAETHNLRLYTQQNNLNQKDLTGILANIEERLRVLDSVSAAQAKQARRLDVIQDKLDRVETALSLRLERAQLAAERLEHRLHMLQTSVQTSIKESSEKLERSQMKISELAQNLTSQIMLHKRLLDKVNGAYADTWHRGLVLEALMRDGLSLVNVTRRELADGLRALARRQRDARFTSADLEAAFTKRLKDNTYKIDLKMKELLDVQKRFVDSCQREQLDDPNQVADVLGKLIDTLINKTASTFHELQNIQITIRNHDTKVQKLISSNRNVQSDSTCRRLESVIRNTTHVTFKENELQQLTEKLVDLTNRADAALQRLETKLKDEEPSSNITDADQLLQKLNGIGEDESDEEIDYEEDNPEEKNFYDDGGGGDIMDEDKDILNGINKSNQLKKEVTERPLHRRHLHKHPYDRGPSWQN
ncbi:unnamed protein product [Diatraea saccharalis]|uniref:Uncharacterized protein n=1 Tax=Diatraea saccharalis TaxID=40085 RepID=A0A9N9WCH3_9NEOP|nr:unnamed protein product [Diatraea saccharalis]